MTAGHGSWRTHAAHWGTFAARRGPGGLEVRPHPDDPEPSELLGNLAAAAAHPARVGRPMVRAGWLQGGPGPSRGRGREPFVPVSWDRALDLVAGELRRVRAAHGPEAVFAGSYGWSSAGRFHHSQSQLRRFFNLIGGAVTSRNSYSAAAAEVILPHVLAPEAALTGDAITWQGIMAAKSLVVAFGGMPRRNQNVGPGGVGRHVARGAIDAATANGAQLVCVSPLCDDLPGAQWIPIRPGTDVALMLALAEALVREERHDAAFVARCCGGFDVLAAYLDGSADGVRKDAPWAAAITGVPAPVIVALAHRMACRPTVVTVANAVQRAEHGEQPVWMGVALAALLGRFGPGAGFASGLGGMAHHGRAPLGVPPPSLPVGTNPVDAFIPVARFADMLLHPGAPFHYDGRRHRYPDARLVYWAGGNPFHHHQHLDRLRRAWERPETVVVHEPYWTATARRADIVLPATISLEREDLGGAANDPVLVAMQRVLDPHGEARDDHAIFAGLAQRLGKGAAFTEGRDARGWIEHLYELTRQRLAAAGAPAPPFAEFWAAGEVALPTRPAGTWLRDFVADPARHPLATPSGRIQLSSPAIAAMGYDDCPGHPAWLPKTEWLGAPRARDFPLQLVANQPRTRLHGQLDFGATSAASKVAAREPVRLHPADARARGIAAGDVVRIFNDRGACLAGAVLSDALMRGVVQLATGAWYDPDDELGACRHGNPNAVTRDHGTSRLAQGSTGQLVLVEVERFADPAPPIRVHPAPQVARVEACASPQEGPPRCAAEQVCQTAAGAPVRSPSC
jgi:biotin/methionine sulfoxide reductase